MNPPQVIVVGAGISGLTCALRLSEMGVAVRVLEATDQPGGLISTAQYEGFLFESGPQSFALTPELQELVRLVGCASELLEADPRAPRYILRGGKLHLAPMSPSSLLTTPLLSLASKLRVVSEPLRRSRPVSSEESLADFVRRKFGTEILEYLAGPFVSGVFAGDPEKLSFASAFPSLARWEGEYGSVIRGALKSRARSGSVARTLASFRAGMATLLAAIARKLGRALATNAAADSIESTGPGGWTVRCSRSGAARQEVFSADAVVVATPAYVARKLLAPVAEPLANTLAGIPYAPIAVVALGYRREHISHGLKGFGFLVPRTERLRILGTVWNSSLFAGRCPPDAVLMTSFLGGAIDPQILAMRDDQIASQVHQELAQVLQISAPPIAQHLWRHARALPQYNLGHAGKVAAMRDELSRREGLFVTGNYLDGPSIESCVSRGFATAKSAGEYLSRRR